MYPYLFGADGVIYYPDCTGKYCPYRYLITENSINYIANPYGPSYLNPKYGYLRAVIFTPAKMDNDGIINGTGPGVIFTCTYNYITQHYEPIEEYQIQIIIVRDSFALDFCYKLLPEVAPEPEIVYKVVSDIAP